MQDSEFRDHAAFTIPIDLWTWHFVQPRLTAICVAAPAAVPIAEQQLRVVVILVADHAERVLVITNLLSVQEVRIIIHARWHVHLLPLSHAQTRDDLAFVVRIALDNLGEAGLAQRAPTLDLRPGEDALEVVMMIAAISFK